MKLVHHQRFSVKFILSQSEKRYFRLACTVFENHSKMSLLVTNWVWIIALKSSLEFTIASLLIFWCENCNETFLRVFKTVCARSLLEAYLSGDLSWWSWEEDEDFIIILSFTKLLRDFELQWTHCLSITSSSEVEKSSISWDHPRKIPTVVYLIIYSTFYSFRKIKNSNSNFDFSRKARVKSFFLPV